MIRHLGTRLLLLSFLSSGLLLCQASSSAVAGRWEQRASFHARAEFASVFTGSEIIVWGGPVPGDPFYTGAGAIYNPIHDTWRETSLVNAPQDRYHPSCVWTGREMLIWGGINEQSGGRYDPQTDSWNPIASDGHDGIRWNHSTIWTGEEMIVWGGETGWIAGLPYGGRYNPKTDKWTPLPPSPLQGRTCHSAIWTGSEMIIFGGHRVDFIEDSPNGYPWFWTTFSDGARYNPATDKWTPLNVSGGLGKRTLHTAVWTGEEMIVYGGSSGSDGTGLNINASAGAIYTPRTDSWRPISGKDAPGERAYHTAVWTGKEMIVWGGQTDIAVLNSGGRYDPETDRWRPTTIEGAPLILQTAQSQTGIWTGTSLFIHYITPDFDHNGTWLYFPDEPGRRRGHREQ